MSGYPLFIAALPRARTHLALAGFCQDAKRAKCSCYSEDELLVGAGFLGDLRDGSAAPRGKRLEKTHANGDADGGIDVRLEAESEHSIPGMCGRLG